MLTSITTILASMLLASSTQPITQSQLQPTKLSEPVVQALKERKVRVVEFGDQSFKVGDQVFGSLYEADAIVGIQSYVDKGLVGQAWNELNNNDGKVTYIAGHNPGVLSNFAGWVQVGKIVTVYDTAGNARSYRINQVMETPMNRAVNGVSADVINYMYYHMHDHEALLIQFCRPERSIMQIWEAVPV